MQKEPVINQISLIEHILCKLIKFEERGRVVGFQDLIDMCFLIFLTREKTQSKPK